MSWHRVDDGFRRHRKTRKAVRLGGRDVVSLWMFTGGAVAEFGTDGVVTRDMIEDAADDLRLSDADLPPLIAALAESGLWHTRETIRSCRCRTAYKHVEPEGGYFHDWSQWNKTNDQAKIPIEHLRWMRKKDLLHDRKLCEAIVARDGARCRYCGERVNFADRKSALGGTYDHIDPDCFEPTLGNFLDAVVVACRGCNGRKNCRTPEEWVAADGEAGPNNRRGGYLLRPVPEPYLLGPDSNAIGS